MITAIFVVLCVLIAGLALSLWFLYLKLIRLSALVKSWGQPLAGISQCFGLLSDRLDKLEATEPADRLAVNELKARVDRLTRRAKRPKERRPVNLGLRPGEE